MSAGESGIITLTGVLSDPLAAGVFINTAIISSATPDADPANNHDDASVAVNFTPVNVEPVAEAGDGQTVFVNATVTLDGSGSDDPDGHLPLTFGWRQTSGPDVTFTPDASITTFTAPTSTAVLNFTLIVTDALGLPSDPDSVTITVTKYYVYLPIISREGPATR